MDDHDNCTSRWFAAAPASVREARRFVRAAVDGIAAGTDEAELLVSELASNVVQHAGDSGAFQVVVRTEVSSVRVEVHDGLAVSDTFRAVVETPLTLALHLAASGRGLAIVRSRSMRLGLDDNGPDGGKAVWFELPRTPERP